MTTTQTAQKQIFIGNIPYSTTESELESLFQQFGSIETVKIPIDKKTNRVRGFAFVTFATTEAAEGALSLNGHTLSGRKLQVNFAEERKDRGETGFGGGASGSRDRDRGRFGGGGGNRGGSSGSGYRSNGHGNGGGSHYNKSY